MGGVLVPIEGTLVVAFLMRNEILLCSDGRVVDALSGAVVRDDWSKVHQLTPMIGLLTLGRYLPNLVSSFRSQWSGRTGSSVLDAVTVLSLSLTEEWRNLTTQPGHLASDLRVFIFIAGFENTGQARLYYLDDRTDPPFTIKERILFADGCDVEIAAMSHGSKGEQNPALAIRRQFAIIQKNQLLHNVRRQLLDSFEAAKDELSLMDSHIGGRTFAATINPARGFHLLAL